MVPWVIPVADAVAVRDVLPVCVVVPVMLVHPVFTELKHTSYDPTPLSPVSLPTFHEADSAVAEFDQVLSPLNDVERSKIFADVGAVGAFVSMVNPVEHVQPDTFPALSVARTHV